MGDSQPPEENLPTKQVTPGWNDPPNLTYNVSTVTDTSTPSKRKLNRRIAFPLSPSPQTSMTQTQESNLPPTMPPVFMPSNKDNVVPIITNKEIYTQHEEGETSSQPAEEETTFQCAEEQISSQEGDENTFSQSGKGKFSSELGDEISLHCRESEISPKRGGANSEESEALLEQALENFNKILVNMPNNASVQKKVDAIVSLWKDNMFTKAIQKTFLNLSKNLIENNVKEAYSLQMQLVMQNAASCGTWIVGIRHLIKFVEERSAKKC